MAATKSAAQEPLDRLQTQVGSVLFQLGNIFRHAHQGDKKALERAKAKAAKGIPDAQNVFQEAIDELERELTKARAVIDRDLQQLQEKRAAREKAAGAARLQTANGAAAQANGPSVKKEPGIGGGDAGGDMASGQSAEDAAVAAAAADIPDDLDALFADVITDGASTDAQGNATGQDPGGASVDDMEDLFGGDISFEGDFGMGGDSGDGSGDGISNLLPGLEKYVNQGQQGNADDTTAAAAANGQTGGAGTDDIDLDALLSGMGDDGGDDAQQKQAATGKNAKGKADGSKTGGDASTQNGQTKDQSQNDDAAQNTNIDADAMDLTFDFGLGDGDGDGMVPGEGIDDWFNFDG